MKYSILKYIIPLFCICLFIRCKEEIPPQYDMAILNGTIIDIGTGDLSTQHLFISEGRIVKMVSSETDVQFFATTVLDAKNKFLVPGFWDNHVHFRGGAELIEANKDFLKLFLANGITTVRDAGGDLTASVMEWKEQIAQGTLAGPTIFTSGPKLDGANATWAGSLVVESEADITTALDSVEQLGVDFVKLYDSRISGELFLETLRHAETRGMLTSGHMPFSVTLGETVDAGIDAIEHLYYVLKGCSSEEGEITRAIANKEMGFWESMEKLIASYDEATAMAAFAQLKDNNTYVVPTLHIGDVLSYLDEEDHTNDPYLKLMDSLFIETYQGRINRALTASEKAASDRKQLNTFFKELAASLNDAGVNLLAGSDSGAYNSYTYPGVSLHNELKAMVGSGLSPLEALRTSAYNGAGFFGMQNDYGALSEGKIADIVLLNTNPLKNISDTRNIHRVIKGTQVYDPAVLAAGYSCPPCVLE